MTFKPKKKPQKPVRKKGMSRLMGTVDCSTNIKWRHLYDNEDSRWFVLRTIDDVINDLQALSTKASSMGLEVSLETDPEYSQLTVYFLGDETDEEYDKRYKKYEKQLAEWDKWAEENREELEKYIAKTEEMEKEKELKERLKNKKSLERELARLQKKLESLDAT